MYYSMNRINSFENYCLNHNENLKSLMEQFDFINIEKILTKIWALTNFNFAYLIDFIKLYLYLNQKKKDYYFN